MAGCNFQEDWGVTVSPGSGTGNGGKRVSLGGRVTHQGALLGTQHVAWEGPVGEGLGLPHPHQDSRLAGGEAETGHPTTERMTHRVQRFAQARETPEPGQGCLTKLYTQGFSCLGNI